MKTRQYLFQFRFVSKENDEKFRRIVKQVVDDREKKNLKRDDLLQVILDLREKYGKIQYNDTVIAGHSMTFLVSLMLSNPQVIENLNKKIITFGYFP